MTVVAETSSTTATELDLLVIDITDTVLDLDSVEDVDLLFDLDPDCDFRLFLLCVLWNSSWRKDSESFSPFLT